MYNSENWTRRDTQGSVVYYGYSSNDNALDTDSNWSIMQVSTDGSVDSVKWANGSPSGISIWDDRLQSFQSPSSLSLTYSSYQTTNYAIITIGWTQSPGVDKYGVLVTDQNNIIYSDSGHQIYNVNGDQAITSTVNSNFYIYKYGNIGSTYSITVISSNVAGTTSSTVEIGV